MLDVALLYMVAIVYTRFGKIEFSQKGRVMAFQF